MYAIAINVITHSQLYTTALFRLATHFKSGVSLIDNRRQKSFLTSKIQYKEKLAMNAVVKSLHRSDTS